MPLTSQQLKEAGIKPGEMFGRCLKLDTIQEAMDLVASTQKYPVDSVKMKPGTVWEWLCEHQCLQGLSSSELPGRHASNSEKRRWILQKCVQINGRTGWQPDDEMEYPVNSLVLFPKSKTRRCTM